MVKEGVLLLIGDEQFGDKLQRWLRAFGVERADLITDSEDLNFRKLGRTYDTVFVEKCFCGNARSTAMLVKRIRGSYRKPMACFELCNDHEGMFPLQVAGCNFAIDRYTPKQSLVLRDLEENICRNVGELVAKIAGELQRPHQKAVAA